jgi:putative flippase GtrA
MNIYARVLKYGAVGVAGSMLYSLLVMLLVDQVGMASATLASALAFAAILPLSYAAHRWVTFSDATFDPLAALRFAGTTTASFLVATGGMYFATQVLARSYLLGIALTWMLIPTVNFLVYLIWVFRVGSPLLHSAPLAAAGPTARHEVRRQP